jgi:CheY-like chemotaxis protein
LTSSVELDLGAHIPPILADADQISQVLINLLANADQAITASGVGEAIRISAWYAPGEPFVSVRVMDDGPGIPAPIRNRIFDPLFTTKQVGEGTGIGLAFCHRVITSHNGGIQLDPATDRGASFTIRLPVAHRQDERSSGERETPRAAVPARVLVIEDEHDVADLIREVLIRDGLQVDHVDSAEAALSILGNQSYTLILTDLNMPGMGGRELYRQLLRSRPMLASKMVFVTGDTMSPSARAFLDAANRPCLEKPIAPSELRRLASSVLADLSRGGGS